jgi:hypothetical protein
VLLVAAILSAWLQYAADAQPHARAIATGTCPAATIDGRSVPMTQRIGTAPSFPDLVCDVAVPSNARSVQVGEKTLPAPAHTPNRIVVFGDTGCRILGTNIQACNDPVRWPFPTIAKSIAAVHPDLIVDVGDYFYRESACPPGDSRCDGTPYGDTAAAWYADWFTPGAPLFAAAPLVLARGNHEDCVRGGKGWTRYLEPHTSTVCEDVTQPYFASFGGLRIVVFDSAVADDTKVTPALRDTFKYSFAAAAALVSGQTWFLTHRPPYLNADERAGMGTSLGKFSAIIVGHVHDFSTYNVAGAPPMVINGTGGDTLDDSTAAQLAAELPPLPLVGTPFVQSTFGFGVYTRTPTGWSISLRNPDGKERGTCTLDQHSVRC